MAYAYVYAPISGTITGRDYYCTDDLGCRCPGSCSGCLSTHVPCKGWASPVDIAGTGSVYLYVNTAVRKVQTWVELRCCSSGDGTDYRQAITVDLYVYNNGKYCYVGSVMYGHVANAQVQNGAWYDLSSSGGKLKLGDVPGGKLWCYSGPHTHMERYLGEVVAPCCCASVQAGTTVIYRFYYNEGYAC